MPDPAWAISKSWGIAVLFKDCGRRASLCDPYEPWLNPARYALPDAHSPETSKNRLAKISKEGQLQHSERYFPVLLALVQSLDVFRRNKE